ncbi:hypothetical protein [Pandoraea anhela]|uniref:Uncharacterized protein n=1 Tax=Pandoraea anhela TaxID=2508295 RepID=A0A5E4UUA4_9BURK|nr:hypothetical protein [Pandoraea anhela]VVE03133.1 hypothetical protein PAN31108_02239 [Pandoraea anhela]
MNNDTLIPLACAAEYLARKRFGDGTPTTVALTALAALGGGPGRYTPVYAARVLAERRYAKQIDALVATRKITLFDPATGKPTAKADGAQVHSSELDEMLSTASLDASTDRELKEAAAGWIGVEEFERKLMALHDNGASQPALLFEWFRFDTWSVDDALRLLVGIDPEHDFCVAEAEGADSTRIVSARHLDGSLVDLNGWRNANVIKDILSGEPGRTLFADELSVTSSDLLELSGRLSSVQRIWNSGNHAARNAPAYYLEWASRKGIDIPWLSWAVGERLVADMPEYSITGKRHLSRSAGISEGTVMPSSNDGGWQSSARMIADELYDRDTAAGCRDSLRGYPELSAVSCGRGRC